MYAYDSSQAFGSWCVKGAGVEGKKKIRPFDRQEEPDFRWLYTVFRPGELLWFLTGHTADPRYQRIIQEAYEMRRKR